MKFLDQLVFRVHRTLSPYVYPYHLALGFALIAIGLLVYHISIKKPQVSFSKIATIIGITQLLYEIVYLRIKTRLFGISARSLLQDSFLILFPTMIVGCFFASLSILVFFDVMGVVTPLGLFFVRIGCFLSGCCYGIPSNFGVLYHPEIFTAQKPRCFKYNPGKDPKQRVFPMQLVECIFHATAFLILYFRLMSNPLGTGATFFIYFFFYSIFRMFADLWRRESNCPRIGPFSQAQVASCICAFLCLLWLLINK